MGLPGWRLRPARGEAQPALAAVAKGSRAARKWWQRGARAAALQAPPRVGPRGTPRVNFCGLGYWGNVCVCT